METSRLRFLTDVALTIDPLAIIKNITKTIVESVTSASNDVHSQSLMPYKVQIVTLNRKIDQQAVDHTQSTFTMTMAIIFLLFLINVLAWGLSKR